MGNTITVFKVYQALVANYNYDTRMDMVISIIHLE